MKTKALLILILCFVSVLSFGSGYELKNSEIKIVFSQEGNNIWVSDIRDEKQGISFLNETNVKEPVWTLKVKKDGDYAGEEIILFPKDAGEVKTETEKESIVFRWSDVKSSDMETGFDVEAKITLSGNNSYWDINISENKEYGFWSVVYPAFSPLDTENNRLMVPFRGGRFYDNYDFDWYYQNPIFLQLMSLTKGKSTLYLCPENLSSSMIYYRIKALGEGNSEYYIENIPGNIAKAGIDYKQSYRFNLAVVGGDWFDAAKKYRKWGIENNYAPFSHGKLETRKDLPKWWKEMSSCVRWFPFIGDVGKQRVLDTQKFLGLPILAHAYGWSEFIMDTTYPNFLPQRENVIPDIEEFHKNNIYVMPYVNAHITDIKNSAIAHALGDAILNFDEKGEVRDTPWQKNIARNVVSCPTPQYK
ncbi:MAG: hypothetical protein KBT47_08625, partial [Armatimonadetes bacterium]|nr:hypothetical protein [Candidatus Hippobium faecium]